MPPIMLDMSLDIIEEEEELEKEEEDDEENEDLLAFPVLPSDLASAYLPCLPSLALVLLILRTS